MPSLHTAMLTIAAQTAYDKAYWAHQAASAKYYDYCDRPAFYIRNGSATAVIHAFADTKAELQNILDYVDGSK
jgi:hypothetical protein